jgi:hypothetical protein
MVLLILLTVVLLHTHIIEAIPRAKVPIGVLNQDGTQNPIMWELPDATYLASDYDRDKDVCFLHPESL